MSDFIYIMGRREGPVKIGITSGDPISRLRMVGTGCPFPIELLHLRLLDDREHARWHEKNIHAVCDDDRLSGEWFDMTCNEAVEQIERSIVKKFHLENQERAA